MNIKSYLRGIGAGMIVTALIMGVQSGKSHAMTEAEIINAAKNLGMVESSTLLEMNKQNAVEASVSSIPVAPGNISDIDSALVSEEAEASMIDREPDVTLPVEPVVLETESTISDDINDSIETEETSTIEPEAINPMPEGEAGFESGDDYVTIRVIKGDSSVSVSRRIFEAGLVESAVEFDRYLCQNGYDKSISVGEYKIPMGSEFDDIAKIVTRRK